MALIAEYLLDEGSGTTAGDNQASPVDLSITSGAWDSIAAGDGYDFNAAGDAVSGNVASGNKIYDTFNSDAYTVITVLRIDDATPASSLWSIREDDFSQSPVRTRKNDNASGGGVRWFWTQASSWISANSVLPTGNICIMAQVYDSANATGADRCRVYPDTDGADFARLTPSSFTEPTSGQTPDFSTVTNAVLALSQVAGIAAMSGAIFYWGLWDEALSESTLESYFTSLRADNDATPSDTPAVVAINLPGGGDVGRRRFI